MSIVCIRCGCTAREEKTLKQYPFYCPVCDENLFSFEVVEVDLKDFDQWLINNGLPVKQVLESQLAAMGYTPDETFAEVGHYWEQFLSDREE